MTVVLSIDPGAKTGGALLPPEGLEARHEPRVFTLKRPSVWEIYRTITWARGFAEADGDTLELVVEDQFLGRDNRVGGGKNKANPQAMLEVARSAEQWITVATLQSVEHVQVKPTTWQGLALAGIPKKNDHDKRLTTDQLTVPAVARRWQRFQVRVGEPSKGIWQLVGVEDLTPDGRAALLMAWWRHQPAPAARELAPRKRTN